MIAGLVLVAGCDRPVQVPETPEKKDAPAVEVLKEVGRSLDEMGDRIVNPVEPAKPKADVPVEKDDPAKAEDAVEAPPVTPSVVPVAEPAEGKPGYIVSPYSGKIVDVRGIPAGTLVQDPDFPSAEKKYFRVPAELETLDAGAEEENERVPQD